jgi:hypothetical protein
MSFEYLKNKRINLKTITLLLSLFILAQFIFTNMKISEEKKIYPFLLTDLSLSDSLESYFETSN